MLAGNLSGPHDAPALAAGLGGWDLPGRCSCLHPAPSLGAGRVQSLSITSHSTRPEMVDMDVMRSHRPPNVSTINPCSLCSSFLAAN